MFNPLKNLYDNNMIEDALLLLDWINSNFILSYKKCDWENIEEIDPDGIDIEMMSDIDTNYDCNEFISINDYMTQRFKRNVLTAEATIEKQKKIT
ncbi:MAG: hypothetical protein FWG98_00915 [Candidatus Cloacimonetes bacterium]|nr:hypothetical protein [Candidatus Cloacimonadota bacterium]